MSTEDKLSDIIYELCFIREAIEKCGAALVEKKKPRKPKNAIGQTLVKEFEQEFWPGVPNKLGKGAAMDAYARARGKTDKAKILAGLHGYRAYEKQRKSLGPDYRPLHPCTWLNQERWNDEVDVKPDRRCSCGRPADGVSKDDAGHEYGWCRECQPKKWSRQGSG
jgi:hypothetical protein